MKIFSKEIKPVHPKGNQPEYSLEGLMLKLKLQYFGHLRWTADSLMLVRTEGRRRRGWQRIRQLDGNTDSMDMSLSKMWELVKDRKSWSAALYGIAKSQTWPSNTITMTGGHYWTCRTKKERKEVASHSVKKPGPFLCKLMCILPHH